MIAIQYIKILQSKISIEADLNNRYIITWMLHQIFMYFDKVILKNDGLPTPPYPLPSSG